jgi:hypothetical protein
MKVLWDQGSVSRLPWDTLRRKGEQWGKAQGLMLQEQGYPTEKGNPEMYDN